MKLNLDEELLRNSYRVQNSN